MADNLPEPKSRKEEFLAKAAGMDGVTLPEPASREELYLNAIAEGGGGGGGGGSTDAVKSFDFTSIYLKGQEALADAGTTEATFSLTEAEYNAAMAGLSAGKTAKVFVEQEGGNDLFIATGGGTISGESWVVTITIESAQYLFEGSESEGSYSCNITEADFGGGSITPVQTTGTSTTDVMSQDAATKMLFPDITNQPHSVHIGGGSVSSKCTSINGSVYSDAIASIAIGASDDYAEVGGNGRAQNCIAIGDSAACGKGNYSIAIGHNTYCHSGNNNTGRNTVVGASSKINGNITDSVALGANARATRIGEVNVGTGGNYSGFNSTDYRVIGGVHDGQDAHDAVTVDQVNATIDAINTALSTNIPHIGAA